NNVLINAWGNNQGEPDIPSEIEISFSNPSWNILLGGGEGKDFNLPQILFNSFKAERVRIGEAWDKEEALKGDIYIGNLNINENNIELLMIETRGRILNDSQNSLLKAKNARMVAYGWINGNGANLYESSIGEEGNPLRLDVDYLIQVDACYWPHNGDYDTLTKNKVYLKAIGQDTTYNGNIHLGKVTAGTFSLEAEGSILDDEYRSPCWNNGYRFGEEEDIQNTDNWYEGISKVGADNIYLIANEDIGSSSGVEDIEKSYLDISWWGYADNNNRLEIISNNDDIYIDLVNGNGYLSNIVKINASNGGLAVIGYLGNADENGNITQDDLYYAGMSFNEDADLILFSRGDLEINQALTTNRNLKLFSADNVIINSTISNNNRSSTIEIIADYRSDYLGVGGDNQGMIYTKGDGQKIISQNNNSLLVLKAASGINLKDYNNAETTISVKNLNAYNKSSGDIIIENDGDLNITEYENNGYGIKNDGSNGKVNVKVNSFLCLNADIISDSVSLTSSGDILDDNNQDTFISAENIILTSTSGNIGGINEDGDSFEEIASPMIDIKLGDGNLTATAENGNVYIYVEEDNVEYNTGKYNLNCHDPSDDGVYQIVFANGSGAITINQELNLSDEAVFVSKEDISINYPVVSEAGALDFSACGNLNINANISLNADHHYEEDNPPDKKLEPPELELLADIDGDGEGSLNIGAVAISTPEGGEIDLGGHDININGSASIDAKKPGNNSNPYGSSNIDIEYLVSKPNIFLGDRGSSDLTISQSEFDTLKADSIAIGDEDREINITVGTLTVNSNNTDFLLLHTKGKIVNNDNNSLLRADALGLSFAQGIGTSTSPLQTQVSNLQATNTISGDIYITNTGNLTLTSVVNSVQGGKVNITVHSNLIVENLNAQGDVSLTSDGDIDVSGAINASGQTVTLDAGGDVIDTTDSNSYLWADSLIITNAQNIGDPEENQKLDTRLRCLQIDNAKGDIYIKETNEALQLKDIKTTGGIIDITVPGNLTLLSNYTVQTQGVDKSIILQAGGDITQRQGSSIITNNGDITLEAEGDVKLTLLKATLEDTPSSDSGDVYVTSTDADGSILDNDGGDAPGDYDIIARNATLTASNVSDELDLLLWINDTTPPIFDEGSVTFSHTSGTWSNDNTIDASWGAATDPEVEGEQTSGVAGYYYLWDNSDTASLDDSNAGFIDSLSLTSGPLADSNDHYFHIAAVDNAGNISDTYDFGPFFIDTTPPVITAARTPEPNLNGWNNEAVTATYTAEDILSGLDANSP
ncbi:MAG: hypothetical protein DRP76_03065, partial [Candidatus Omnitrophota bacterium]